MTTFKFRYKPKKPVRGTVKKFIGVKYSGFKISLKELLTLIKKTTPLLMIFGFMNAVPCLIIQV